MQNVGNPYIKKTYNFDNGKYIFDIFQTVKIGRKEEVRLVKRFDHPFDAEMEAFTWMRNNTKVWAPRR